MIVDLIIDLLSGMILPLLDLLPDVNLDAFVASVSTGAASIGTYLGHADTVVPIAEVLSVLSLMVSLFPVLFGYTVFKFVWRHIPTIAGFGTGTG